MGQYDMSLPKIRKEVCAVMTQRSRLLAACASVLCDNLALRKGEQVLVITDPPRQSIGELFQEAAGELTDGVELIEIPVPSFNGEEPPGFAAEKMCRADVILLPLSKSLSWTEARVSATRTGARIASMPGITEEIILRTFQADYAAIRERVNRLCDLMDEADQIRVTTALGTELSMQVKGRKGRGRRGGIYNEKGAWGNLPCGEAFIAPLEGTCTGTYVVDAAQAGVGKLEYPIAVLVTRGRAVEFQGGDGAELLASLLKDTGSEAACNIAELGIGCNPCAVADSIPLEAEKALGTCHVAVGSNIHFGGTVNVNIHLDGVMKEPTINFDGEKILDKGIWRIDT